MQNLPWNATLVAVDGNVTKHVEEQLKRVPGDTTRKFFARYQIEYVDIFISVGGNDALRVQGITSRQTSSVGIFSAI